MQKQEKSVGLTNIQHNIVIDMDIPMVLDQVRSSGTVVCMLTGNNLVDLPGPRNRKIVMGKRSQERIPHT